MGKGDVKKAVVEALGSDIVPPGELLKRLAAAGRRTSESELFRLIQLDTSLVELPGGFGYVPAIVDGVAFASPIDKEDSGLDELPASPWLSPLAWWMIEEHPELHDADGEPLGPIETAARPTDAGGEIDVIQGPDGWLAPHAGRWLGLRVVDNALRLEPHEERPEPSTDVAAAQADTIRAAFDRADDSSMLGPVGDKPELDPEAILIKRAHTDDVVLDALAHDPSAFQGSTIVVDDEFFERAGLRIDDATLVSADIEPSILIADKMRRRAKARYGADPQAAEDIERLIDAIHRFEEDDPHALGRNPAEQEKIPLDFRTALAKDVVGAAIAVEAQRELTHDVVFDFAETLIARIEPNAQPPVAWGLHWLKAHCQLMMGLVDDAAATLAEIPLDETHRIKLTDAARLEMQRSNAVAARQLLTKAQRLQHDDAYDSVTLVLGRVIDDLLDEVEPWASHSPPPRARRNDRCPCGSGRKYKACHQGRELHPIEDRSMWLWQKMVRFARLQDPYGLEDLAFGFDEAMGVHDSAIIDAPLLPDLMLHEGRLLADYLRGASKTLPDDEVLLAQQWQLTDRGVFEVESMPAGSLRLRNLGTGDRLTVVNTDGPPLQIGSLLIGRPLPVGDVHRAFSGFMSLHPRLVEEAIELLDEGDPDEIVAFLGWMHRAPSIANTDGQPMEITELAWSVPVGVDLDARLEPAGFRCDGNEWVLIRDTANQRRSIIATLRLDGTTLTGSVNSRERADELVATIEKQVPEAELTGRDVRTLDDIDLSEETEPPGRIDLSDNPEVRQFLEDHIAQYETEWLDTSIPALGGQTPREAAADAIGRETLIRLLASFPEPTDGPGMSATRLRAKLGLD